MQKGFSGIIVLIVVLILAGLGGAYFLGKLPIKPANNTPKACTQEAKICPYGSSVGRTGPNCEFAACPLASPVSNEETSNWKTYVNTKYGFSMKYPNNYSADNFGSDDKGAHLEQVCLTVIGSEGGCMFNIFIRSQSLKQYLDDYLTIMKKDDNYKVAVRDYNLGNYQAKLIEDLSSHMDNRVTFVHVLVQKDDKLLEISTGGWSSSEQDPDMSPYEKYLKLMLSTFRFD